MSDNFSHLNEEKGLKAENDFMKMKLMLEHDAQFTNANSELPPLSPAMENDFLAYLIAFEEQAKDPRYIKVFDRIGRPTCFKAASEIPDYEIVAAWDKLQIYLFKYSITLDACSPNVSTRELYRFTTEELFEYEMSDISIAGMVTNFIYDEFHPDPIYDNTKTATEDCVNYILEQKPIEWTHNFRHSNLKLNNHFPITVEKFKEIVNKFKLAYDDLQINDIKSISCIVNGNECSTTGNYSLTAINGIQAYVIEGTWEVGFEKDIELGYWYINNVQIVGINFL